MSPAVIVLSPAALPVARRLADALPEAELHGLLGRVEGTAVSFAATLDHLRALFAAGRPIIGVCAAGILIRAVAPLLTDKTVEPPVVAVAVDGSAAVPLLGGHRGANALAHRIARALGGVAAITTAGDVALGAALDDPPPGWTLTTPQAAPAAMAAALAGQPLGLVVERGDASWLAGVPTAPAATPRLYLTDRAIPAPGDDLIYHPRVLALGVGCERDAPAKALIATAEAQLAAHGLAPQAVACVVSVDVKADEAAVHALAAHLGVPARFFPADRLEEETPRLRNPSDVVFQEVGCHGVAEAAALAAAGSAAELVVPKVKGARVTVAIARAPDLIDPATVGRARGRLTVVGIGPGAEGWRTPAVSRAVAAASDLVGYGLYLDLLGPLAAGKARHESDLGREEDRARRALDLAAQGRTVALVCSGDAGIYALATLVYELLAEVADPAWKTVEVSVEPGVSALQAAAARAGAPIGHDFCTISLSNLLTPWEVIEQRLKAAAAGDFVVAFYNPVSQRRREGLAKARDILLTGRPGATPVILARNLGRPGESVTIIPLAELTPDHADMLTLVMVGNRETRPLMHGGRHLVYTPRGYAQKRDTP